MDTKEDSYSCIEGFNILFWDNNHKINLRFNLFFPGYEKIFVDGKLITSKFIVFDSVQHFKIGEDSYTIKYYTKKLFSKGDMIVELIKNGHTLHRKKILLKKLTKKKYILQIFLLGAILGFLSGIATHYKVPFFILVIFSIILPYLIWLCRLLKRVEIVNMD